MACLFQKIVSFDKESYFCIETINIKLSFHSMNFVEELKWRGMVHTMMPGTEELFEKGIVTAYLGIDPTADSLHIGHLCGVMMLRHFQRCGHKPIALLGGATGMIGDPSGKSQERNLLDENTLRHNQECIKKQLSKFLDFDSDAPNHAELVNNYDWMKDFSFLDFARLIRNNYRSAWQVSHHMEAYAKEIAYSPYISELNGDDRETYRRSLVQIAATVRAVIELTVDN